MPTRRVALAIGDTAGHFYPALAVAEAFRRRAADTEIAFFGPRGVGAELAARHQCHFYEISGGQLVRTGFAGRIVSTAHTLAGIVQARRLLSASQSRLVIGFGGYASGAILLAARSRRLATAIHEANIVPGLANRWLAPKVDRVFVNHIGAAAALSSPSARVLGWPVRAEIAALAGVPRSPWRDGRPARILVCAASRGGEFFAREIPAALERVAAAGIPIEVRHQSGDVASPPIAAAYTNASISAQVSPFIDDVADAYRWADVAIVRAGAGTLAEISIAGVPALLVPLADAADDHQTVNARAFVTAGAAMLAEERDWDSETVARQLAQLLRDPDSSAAMSAAARRLAAPGAADALVDDCEELMRGRW